MLFDEWGMGIVLVAIGVAYIRDGAAIRSAGGGRPDDETSAMDGGGYACLQHVWVSSMKKV